MSTTRRLLWQLLVVAAVAVLAAWLTSCFLAGTHRLGLVGRHYSVHEQLQLSREQLGALAPLEQEYEKRWEQVESKIAQADDRLARSLRRDQGYSAEVATAVDEITRAQAELQRLTLEHVFAMKPYLTPEQYRRLLDLCADSIEKK